eukprot:4567317-Amphidinium_carterae.1
MPLLPQAAEDGNASRQAELTRLACLNAGPLPRLATLAAQIHSGPDSVQHIATKKIHECASKFFENPQQWRLISTPHQQMGAKVWTPAEKYEMTKHFVMKIAYLLDKWGLDWARTASPTGTHGWCWKGKDEKAGLQRPSKQAVTVTLVTSAVKAKVAAQIIFHGATEKAIPQVVIEVWMSCSPNHWVSTQTLQQLFTKMEELVNAETPQKPFVVLMVMAPVHTSSETMSMLKENFPWIGIIMIPPHCTSFLQPCDVGLMRPFKSVVRRTSCERYAKTIFNNTDAVGN